MPSAPDTSTVDTLLSGRERVGGHHQHHQRDDDRELVELADRASAFSIQVSQVISRSSKMKSRNSSSRKTPPNAAIAGCACAAGSRRCRCLFGSPFSSASRTASTGFSLAVMPDDQQREDQPHAEHGDRDADGQEDLLPERAHPHQHGGVDDRVVEGQRHLEHGEDRDHGKPGRAAVEEAEREADDGDDERPAEGLEEHGCDRQPTLTPKSRAMPASPVL